MAVLDVGGDGCHDSEIGLVPPHPRISEHINMTVSYFHYKCIFLYSINSVQLEVICVLIEGFYYVQIMQDIGQ